jgi:UDP-2,3-diacylglucosamine pyrophosphatase LpxH
VTVSIRRALIIPDTHRPFHSRKAYSLMLEVASFVGVDEVVLLGDYCDMYEVSRHPKDKRIQEHLLDEVESVNAGLDELDRLFPKAKKMYLEGNHEIRLENYLLQAAPALFGVTDIRSLFKIKDRPLWTYQGFGRAQAYRVLGTNLFARHRPLANNALSGLQRAGVSYVYGDIHKIQEAQQVALDGSTRVAFCPGWLGETRHRVFDYMISPAQWQHGFALVSVDGASKSFHHEIVQIKDNVAITHGRSFKA